LGRICQHAADPADPADLAAGRQRQFGHLLVVRFCWPGFWRAGGWCGWLPGVSGEEGAQDGEGVVAVLTGGVNVAADVQPVLGGVVAGEGAWSARREPVVGERIEGGAGWLRQPLHPPPEIAVSVQDAPGQQAPAQVCA
jgi:hypothetical protein